MRVRQRFPARTATSLQGKVSLEGLLHYGRAKFWSISDITARFWMKQQDETNIQRITENYLPEKPTVNGSIFKRLP